MQQAHIFDAVRTPRGVGKSRGSLYTVRPVDLLSTCLRALAQRSQLETGYVDDVVIGCVTQTKEQGSCIARTAVLEAGFDHRAAAVSVNRFCGSGLQAINQSAAIIGVGFAELMIAGGVESMSRVPMGSDGGAIYEPAAQWSFGSVPQGISADLIATLRGFTRADVDNFALTSQKRAEEARLDRRFAESLVPLTDAADVILAEDEHPRCDTTLEKLAALRPSFELIGKQFAMDSLTKRVYPQIEAVSHVHTAGNSSGIVDGASAILLGNLDRGQALGLRPRAKIRAAAVVGDEPVLMLNGPIPATRKVLKLANMELADIDLFEVNEAFAAIPLAYMQEFDLDDGKVNVNGGSIAFGHPLGATGAMLLNTLLDELERRGLGTGLVTMCIGGGMGIATIIERV